MVYDCIRADVRVFLFVMVALMQVRSGQLYVIAAAVLWGTTGTAQALAPSGTDPIGVGTLRLLVGGLGLLGFALVRGGLQRPHTWPLKPVLGAGLSVAVYQLCFFGGVARTGIAVGTIIAIGSAPVMAGMLGWWLRGDRPSWRWYLATALAVMGAGFMILSGGDNRVDLTGILLALGAGLAYALYTVASKQLLDHYAPGAVMAVIFCLGAVFLLPLLFVVDLHWLAEPGGLLMIIHLGLIATTLSYILFAQGLRMIFAATAVTLSLAEPLTAAILGIVLLGERLTSAIMVGIGLLLAGLLLLSVPESLLKRMKRVHHEFP